MDSAEKRKEPAESFEVGSDDLLEVWSDFGNLRVCHFIIFLRYDYNIQFSFHFGGVLGFWGYVDFIRSKIDQPDSIIDIMMRF